MNKYMNIFRPFPVFFLAQCLLALFSGCLFDTTKPVEPLTMTRVDGNGDTVAPFPSLRFAFSKPLADSTVELDFYPPTTAMYYTALNGTKDTLTLTVVGMLAGDTRFVVRLASIVASRDGSLLYPGDDSTVIFTGQAEHEPNNSIQLSDTLFSSSIFGLTDYALDTDVYVVPGAQQRRFFLVSPDGRDSCVVLDSMLRQVAPSFSNASSDSFFIPDTIPRPLYVFIFSSMKGTGGHYEFGSVTK
jgi:hypothetical protein